MSKSLWTSSIVLAIAAFFVACDDSTTSSEKSDVSSIAAFKNLAECAEGNEGEMVYVKDSAAMFLCSDKVWKEMSVSGLKGSDGKDGVDGKEGKDGVDGKSGKDGNDGKDGKDGENGKDGSSCTVESIEGGYKVLCGGDSIGVLLNGAKGDSGPVGPKGEGCIAEEIKNGVKITCDNLKEPVVIKNGSNGADGASCKIVSDEGGVVKLQCGDDAAEKVTLYKAMCGTLPFDPQEDECMLCGMKPYLNSTSFCDNRGDATVYKKVTIAPEGTKYSKTWMAENLNFETAEGSFCFGETADDKKPGNCKKYGRLYTWTAMINGDTGFKGNYKGICPTGWHLPSKAEWESLIENIGGSDVAGKLLKSTEGWSDDANENGSDAYGFNALPVGFRHSDGSYPSFLYVVGFWSSTEYTVASDAYCMSLNLLDEIFSMNDSKDFAYSVRCIQD